MPNWCENTLTISGSEELLNKFQQKAKGKRRWDDDENCVLQFNQFVPCPDNLIHGQASFDNPSGLVEYGGRSRHKNNQGAKVLTAIMAKKMIGSDTKIETDNAYDWELVNWGCKWGARDADVGREPNMLTYDFSTAWSPPEEWVKTVAKQYPKLIFNLKYCEPGMCFAGEMQLENGKMIFHEDRQVPQYEEEE